MVLLYVYAKSSKVVLRDILQKKVFCKYIPNLQEDVHVEVLFQSSYHASLLKSHFCMSVFLQISCILAEHFFVRTVMEDPFCKLI